MFVLSSLFCGDAAASCSIPAKRVEIIWSSFLRLSDLFFSSSSNITCALLSSSVRSVSASVVLAMVCDLDETVVQLCFFGVVVSSVQQFIGWVVVARGCHLTKLVVDVIIRRYNSNGGVVHV